MNLVQNNMPWWCSNGTFGRRNDSSDYVYWERCRELVLDDWVHRKTRGFYFYHSHANLVGPFIEKIENLLQIKKRSRTQIKSVKCESDPMSEKVIYIIPSSFWRRHWLKMSLFLSLVRIGANHGSQKLSKTKVWKILKHDLLKSPSVFRASKRFLQGHTKIKLKKQYKFKVGWYNIFAKLTPKQTKAILR